MTKIMLVEDDKSLREIYGVRLLAEGYDIVSAGDGEEALAMAIKERPQLIVSDVMMPKISGFDMLDILRSTTETKNIKVIMMTALSSEEQRARGEQLGAERYLVKSQIGIEDVVRSVHEVLGDSPVGKKSPAPTGNSMGSPAKPPAPSPSSQPAPAPQSSAPATTPQSSPPASPPAPAPSDPTKTSSTSSSAPSTSASSIPQPTAPFSSPRPASLGERVIQPLPDNPRKQVNINDLLDRELTQERPSLSPTPSPQVPPTPPPPTTPPAPEPPSNPAPEPVQPSSDEPPQPPAAPSAPEPSAPEQPSAPTLPPNPSQ